MADKKPKTKKINNTKSIWTLILISFILAITVSYLKLWQKFIDEEISLNRLEQNFNSWTYSSIFIDWNKAIATVSWSNSIVNWIERIKRNITILPNSDSLKDLWLKNPEIKTDILVKDKSWDKFWSEMWPTIIWFILFFLIAIFLINKMWWMTNNAMMFGKSRARLYDKEKDKITFADVAWAEEEKEELQEVIEFLKNPKKFRDLWAKIPRWILLVWPPWTWKTLLARAVAWESDVPFLSISWSEFVEMFVWVWASRVRDLFTNAKKLAPAIIFIDEIDAIGKKRWPWTWWWHDEREQTLNQILTEMDWFDNETNIIVLWATNRADVLDKALLRPWRFDRKITVRLPNLVDRELILKVHTKGKKISSDVDLKSLASSTIWFSWADLWNLINEATIITARNNEKIISNKRIQEAFERVVMWLRKKSLVMDDQERKLTAYHEIWHALVWQLLTHTDPVHKISITPRWWALWVTWFLPERDELLTSKAKFLDELATLYWWRAAEEVFFGEEYITTWASNDIEKATNIARAMVTKYGMYDDIWKENFSSSQVSWNYLWVESDRPFYSEETQKSIDKRVKEILDNAYNVAITLIKDNKDLHIKISEDLLEKEEISREEFSLYFS